MSQGDLQFVAQRIQARLRYYGKTSLRVTVRIYSDFGSWRQSAISHPAPDISEGLWQAVRLPDIPYMSAQSL